MFKFKKIVLVVKPFFKYKCVRYKNSLGLWDEDISTEIKHKIEQHWANEVMSNKKVCGKSMYILPMFPYPSGNLHMGHVRVYSLSDSIARYNKLKGKAVIHPIGWDAFGLPAENAAIERNILPKIWTKSNIKSMKEQLIQLGFNFDWNREISTCDPQYYKWTQYIFLKLFEKGLAYQSKATVHWDPIDKTVLADEQVDDKGCSWRSGAKVEKKNLTQWYIKTTQFAKKLYDGLDNSGLENWNDIIAIQKNWIGECNGIVVYMNLKIGNNNTVIGVWSSDPYKFIHGECLFIKKDNDILNNLSEDNKCNIKCFNPLTNSVIRVYVTDEINYPEGRQVYIACPSLDPEDKRTFELMDIPIISKDIVIDVESENKRATRLAQDKECGGHFVSSKLRDWLVSRQRYWGTPIPIIHCSSCGTVPVPYDQLPVELPDRNDNDLNKSNLTSFESWVNCKCPKCLGDAKRETDTLDTFVDSSWYYYRFLDPNNSNLPFQHNKLVETTPVNIYIGGKEHALLHLYFARFMSYFLNSIDLSPTKEPFKKLLVQGLVMGQSYKVKSSGKYIQADCVEKVKKQYREKGTGEIVIAQWEKMSKSKYNGENPYRLIGLYGCDTTRLLMIADVMPANVRKWSDATVPGVLGWQHRLWIIIREFLEHKNNDDLYNTNDMTEEKLTEYESKLWKARNDVVGTATFHYEHSLHLNNVINQLQALTNTLRRIPPEAIVRSKEYEMSLAYLIVMLSPITPHFCSELWAGLSSVPRKLTETSGTIAWDKGLWEQNWPAVDANFPTELECRVDGDIGCKIALEASKFSEITHDDALQMVLEKNSIKSKIKNDIIGTKYERIPGRGATLYIFTDKCSKPMSKLDELVKKELLQQKNL